MTKLRLLTIMGLSTLALSVSACNTIGGAGQDIENAGEAVQKAAS